MDGLDLSGRRAEIDASLRPRGVRSRLLLLNDKPADEGLFSLAGVALVAESDISFDLIDAGIPVDVKVALDNERIPARHHAVILIEKPAVELHVVGLFKHFDRRPGVLLAELLAGDVEKLPLSENEGNKRAFAPEALDLENVLEFIAIETRLGGY